MSKTRQKLVHPRWFHEIFHASFWKFSQLPFPVACASHSKFVKSLQAQYDPSISRFLLNLISGGLLQFGPTVLQSLHQINLTFFFHFIFHFLSLDSIDYIMIILELISPQQRTIEQKYLLTTQKKSQLLKKKKTANIVTPPSCPPAINYRSSRI